MTNFLHRTVVAIGLLVPSAASAQAYLTAPLILRLPASARTLAMGDVGIVGLDDDVLFYNPAQLVAARGTSISAEKFLPSARAGALSAVGRFNNGGIAVGATTADFTSANALYPVTRADMLAGGTILGTSTSLVLGIAQTAKGTRIGGSVKYVEERLANTRNARGLLDLGVARDVLGTALGLSVQNIGRGFPGLFPQFSPPAPCPVRFECDGPSPTVPDMPLRATLGAGRGTQAGPFDVLGTAALSITRHSALTAAGGGEISYSWLDGYAIALRAGARGVDSGEGWFTTGAGFSMDRLSVDYALETLSHRRVAHRIGLRIR